MKQELQQKLFDKYPEIFYYWHRVKKDKHSPKIPIEFGIECNDGWYWLIDNLCEKLQFDTDKNDYPQVRCHQCKEKFGMLRFYTGGINEIQVGMIRLAEHLSYDICERCGTTENVSQNKRGWIRTLCDECREEIEE